MSRLYFRVIALDVPPVLFSEIMAGMVLSICLIFNHRWIAKKERLLVIPSLRYGFAFVPLTLLILLYALILPNIVCPQMAVWIALGILFIDCIYSTLFWIVKNTLHRLWTRYLQELDRQVTNQNNAAQQDASLTLRGFRHDVKHHLLMLHDLANKSQAQDIIKYLQKIDEAVAISDQSIRSGNSMIDTILNAMIHNAHTQDCSIQVEAHLPTNLQLPIFEINAILSNLFENAIENAAISDEKEIIGSIFLNKGILFIDIVNSTQKEIPFAPDEYPTHKEDPVNHGLGLKIIQQMVDRLDGEMNIQHEKNRFRVTVMLYIQYNTT
jgi:two-component sensor histidine kinase